MASAAGVGLCLEKFSKVQLRKFRGRGLACKEKLSGHLGHLRNFTKASFAGLYPTPHPTPDNIEKEGQA